MPNKIILLLFWLISKIIKRNKNLWIYVEGKNNSALPLLKYAKKIDCRKHIYITPFKTQINKLKNEGILAFKPSSLLGCYYIVRAKVHITSIGLEELNKYLSGGALVINLFHGIPIKKIAIAEYNYKIKNTQKSTFSINRNNKKLKKIFNKQIFLCATSDLTQQLFSNCFGVNKNKFPIVGEPRNDILCTKHTNRNYIIKHIDASLKEFTTIFAYMPTWRDRQIWDTGIDFEKMNSFLLQYNCALIIRYHHLDNTFSDLSDNHSNIFISNSYIQEWSDAYNELVGIDVLISDYSSLIYEFLITNRPVLIYTPDYQSYKKMRGFLVKFNTHIPSKRLNNYQDLVNAMLDVINGIYDRENYNKIKNLYHKYTDNNSSKRVYEQISSNLTTPMRYK